VTMERTAPGGSGRDEAAGETLTRRLLTLARQQLGLTALALIAVVGLGISVYLTIVHYDSGVKLVCNTTGLINCQSVTSSAYSVVPGTSIPITIPGMLWFLALGALAVAGLRWAWRGEAEDPRLRISTLLLTVAGLVFIIYLVYCEIVLVQRICEWCTVVHLLTLASFLIALTRWRCSAQRGTPPDRSLPVAGERGPAISSAGTGLRAQPRDQLPPPAVKMLVEI